MWLYYLPPIEGLCLLITALVVGVVISKRPDYASFTGFGVSTASGLSAIVLAVITVCMIPSFDSGKELPALRIVMIIGCVSILLAAVCRYAVNFEWENRLKASLMLAGAETVLVVTAVVNVVAALVFLIQKTF